MNFPRVFVVYVQFTDKHMHEGMKILIPWVARILPGLEAEFLVVDNAKSTNAEVPLKKNIRLIGGDNSCREFSGFDKGVRWFETNYRVKNEDVFIFVNDSFFRSYETEYLNWFFPDAAFESLKKNKIVGYVDAYPEEIEVLGLKCRSWVRTSLFLLNYSVLKKLFPFVLPCDNDQIFSPDGAEFFRKSAPMSANYKQFLRTWLFGEVPEGAAFRETWHSRRMLAPANHDYFRKKAKAVLCEHFLSARAKMIGVHIHDVRQYSEAGPSVPSQTVLLVAVSHGVFSDNNSKLVGKDHKPLGILSLATFLKKKKGFSVVCIDQRLEDPVAFIKTNHRELLFVGLSVMTADYAVAKEILERIKAVNPDLPCVIGGPHASAASREAIQDGFDIAVIGEGEVISGEIADIIKSPGFLEEKKDKLCAVQSIAFRDREGRIIANPRREFIEDLDILPPVDRSFLSYPHYSAEQLTLSTSRGCPGRCFFCQSGPNLFGRKIRQRSVRSVISEIKDLLSSGYNFINFLDDCLLWNENWVYEFCDAVKKEKLRFTWICETRAQFITEPVLKAIIEAGCRGLNIGFESGSDNTLRFLKKGASVALYRKSIDILHRHGLQFHAYVIMGSPYETKEDLDATVRFIRDARPAQVAVSRLTPIRGSELFEYVLQKNLISNVHEQAYYQNRCPIKCEHLTPEDLDQYEVEIYKAMYISGALPAKRRGGFSILEDPIPPTITDSARHTGTLRVKNTSNFNWIAYPDPVRVPIEELELKRSRDNFYQQIEGCRVELCLGWFDASGRLVRRNWAGHLIGNVPVGECGTFVFEYEAPERFTQGYLEYDLVLPEEQKQLTKLGYKPLRHPVEVVSCEKFDLDLLSKAVPF